MMEAPTTPPVPAESSPRVPRHAPHSSLLLLGALVVGGLLLAPGLAPALFGLDGSGGWPRYALVAGAVVLVGGALVYCLWPALSWDEAVAVRGLWGTHSEALLDLLAVVLLAAPLSAGGLAAYSAVVGSPPVVSEGGQFRLRPEGILLGVVLTDLPMLLVLWGRVIRPGAATWPTLGLRFRGPEDIRLGLTSGLGVLLLMGVVGGLLRLGGFVSDQLGQFAVQGASPGGLALALLGGAVFAPLVEELFFRGYLYRSYATRNGAGRGAVYSALLFAVVHLNPVARANTTLEAVGPLVAVFVPIFCVGLVLAYLFRRTGSLVPGMIAHGVNNATAFIVLFAGLPTGG